MDTDPKRDLYADLELSGPTNDIDLVRRQYRKLSLKKHPDRPGGSNEAFNIINHAHAILTDPEKKRKYDADSARRNRSYASGVKGNPWSNLGKEWAPPPRPPNFPERPPPRPTPATQKRQSAATNADKYADFTAGAPRRAQPKKADTAHHWQAWEDMRSGSKGKATGQASGSSASARTASSSNPSSYQQPPPVPPRAPPQKQPKGAFGARTQRGGYVPESPGDEPAVSGNNYFTTRTHSNLFTETSSAARARRRAPSRPDPNGDSAFTDSRQSTPYQTHGGEKFDPWNGASNIGRSRSTREPNRRPYDDGEEGPHTPGARPRSASVSDNIPQAGQDGSAGLNGNRSSGAASANSDYRSSEDGLKNGSGGNGKDSSKLYANSSHFSATSTPYQDPQRTSQATGRAGEEDLYNSKTLKLPPELETLLARQAPISSSEDKSPYASSLNAFEQKLSQVLARLSASKYGHGLQPAAPQKGSQPQSGSQQAHPGANANFNDSFGSRFADESFAADSHRFTRNSTDNINTRFVAEEDATNWQFNAGSPVDETGRPTVPRTKSGSRAGRRSPLKSDAPQTPFAGPPNGASSPHNDSFNPEDWSEKIGPQIFEAPAAQKTSVAGGRTVRNPNKKTKPVRMTAGTAGMVESDESSSGLEDATKGSAPASRGHSLDGGHSPMAMDVDPPQGESNGNGARNIPVTPSRPEWRAGNVGLGIKVDVKPAAGQPADFAPAAGGSEDSEEFRASFADIRNVEPFAERATGLDSFGDLKLNLPFPSAAAGHAPVKKPVSRPHNICDLLPEPPKAPSPPPALAVTNLKPSAVSWRNYVEAFYTYLSGFHAYNTKFIDHFAARKVQIHHKLGNPAWLESRDGTGIQEYMTWAEEDRQVRTKWADACNEHEMNVRLFAAHREKMMK